MHVNNVVNETPLCLGESELSRQNTKSQSIPGQTFPSVPQRVITGLRLTSRGAVIEGLSAVGPPVCIRTARRQGRYPSRKRFEAERGLVCQTTVPCLDASLYSWNKGVGIRNPSYIARCVWPESLCICWCLSFNQVKHSSFSWFLFSIRRQNCQKWMCHDIVKRSTRELNITHIACLTNMLMSLVPKELLFIW